MLVVYIRHYYMENKTKQILQIIAKMRFFKLFGIYIYILYICHPMNTNYRFELESLAIYINMKFIIQNNTLLLNAHKSNYCIKH